MSFWLLTQDGETGEVFTSYGMADDARRGWELTSPTLGPWSILHLIEPRATLEAFVEHLQDFSEIDGGINVQTIRRVLADYLEAYGKQ